MITTFSTGSFAFDKCSKYLIEYNKVLESRAILPEFVYYFKQGVVLSEKQEYFNNLSSDEKLKGQVRVATYCRIQYVAGVDLRLSKAINESL